MQYGQKKRKRMDSFEIPAQLKLRKKRVVMVKLHSFCILDSTLASLTLHRAVSYINIVFSVMVFFLTTPGFCKGFHMLENLFQSIFQNLQ